MPTVWSEQQLALRVSRWARGRRLRRFNASLAGLQKPLHVVDLGGTVKFWEFAGWAGDAQMEITIVNLRRQPSQHPNIRFVEGDVTDVSQFANNSFDLVFSNSVIEHLYTLENQRTMAAEVQRLAPRYWIQTPNYWFPVEPHFRFIGWQWLPQRTRVAMLRRRRFGWRARTPDAERARALVEEVRLLTRRELKDLFPGARIEAERLLGLVKSWTVVKGF